MGHSDGSVQARYSHITADMRRTLLDGLTGLWLTALDQRRAMSPRSPVAALDRLLIAQAKIESLTLVSADPEIAKYDVEVIW